MQYISPAGITQNGVGCQKYIRVITGLIDAFKRDIKLGSGTKSHRLVPYIIEENPFFDILRLSKDSSHHNFLYELCFVDK